MYTIHNHINIVFNLFIFIYIHHVYLLPSFLILVLVYHTVYRSLYANSYSSLYLLINPHSISFFIYIYSFFYFSFCCFDSSHLFPFIPLFDVSACMLTSFHPPLSSHGESGQRHERLHRGGGRGQSHRQRSGFERRRDHGPTHSE